MQQFFEIAALAIIPLALALDPLFRARRLVSIRYWRVRASIVTLLTVAWSVWVALTLGSTLSDFSLFNLSPTGLWGAPIGVLGYAFVHYWYHRSVHSFSWLWRIHQMHHSAERMDTFGATWLHPVDAAIFTVIQIVVFFPVLGLAPEAGALAALFLSFSALFQHANVKTPRWLGYFLERPESHVIHHARGVHAYNYSDIPLWDIIFGTFKNPKSEEVASCQAGFYDGASSRLIEMLTFRDVSVPRGEVEREPGQDLVTSRES
jgi:sterol desaturase/sphingolipid hydroxylase (fatty acid hydroxylase superfamily)